MNREDRDLFPAEPEMTAQRRHRRRTGDAGLAPRPAEETAVQETPVLTPDALTAGIPAVKSPAGECPAAPETPVSSPDDPTAEISAAESPAEMPQAEFRAVQEADVPAAEEPPKDVLPETVREAGSRVPAEARRMAAAPYGVRGPEARRPGTRPMVAARRPETEPQRKPAPRPRPVRPNHMEVGYAPGRMTDGKTDDATRQVPAAEETRRDLSVRQSLAREPWPAPEGRRAPGNRSAREYLERRGQPLRNMKPEESAAPVKPAGPGLRVAVLVLVLLGAVLAVLLALGGGGHRDPRVFSFVDSNPEDLIAPADVVFSVNTGKEVEALRLVDEDGKEVPAEQVAANNADGKLWNLTLRVENGFDGQVRLEVRAENEQTWHPTEFTSVISVRSLPTAAPDETADAGAAETAAPETAEAGEEGETAGPEAEETESGETETGTAAAKAPEEGGEEPEDVSAVTPAPEEEAVADEPADDFAEVGALRTQPPTPTPAPEEETPTETPPLKAEADPEANPDLLSAVTVYTGTSSKKIKDYSRPAKELIHMPEASEYTPRKVGVLTFRGDNFRTNAACGTLETPAQELRTIWQVEGGSSRGATQTYYGYSWPGQAAIVKWSKQVRAASKIYDSKLDKEMLKEVIIAGMDGAIRFLDLDDGSLTRNSIKLGYPLKGTPSVHPYYQPFMSVGQYARKMKVKTGKIGLRQYNLYSMKELKLIDGLDGKAHRPLNDVGSFETSALIDRNSDTLIAAGSNGVLYLEALNPTFDWKMGVMNISPSVTMMTSKTKNGKAAQTAVESSLAAYDKYVFYADMGGILRCVDTDFLTPVWAVDTGDAVMASVALDMTEDRNLNLYTANMLANRRKGNGEVQIRRYDALSGKELWCTEVGVYKGKKDKEDVGAKASPVIGQNSLSDLVYFTVTGLSEDGRAALGLTGGEKAALLALDKATGGRVWVHGITSRAESSPVAVYDVDGNGWIIQCAEDGTIELMEGLTGKTVSTLTVEGQIEASPAVYDDIMVVGTTGKGTSYIYGVRIAGPGTPSEEEIKAAREAAENPENAPNASEGEEEDSEEDAGEEEDGGEEEEWNAEEEGWDEEGESEG